MDFDDGTEDGWQLQIALHESSRDQHHPHRAPHHNSPFDEAPTRENEIDQLAFQSTLEASLREQRQREDAELAEDLQVSQVILMDEAHATLGASMDTERQSRPNNRAGVWDCEACTFRNPPFHPRCQACQIQPPDQILTFRRLSADRIRFGVEVEILVEKGRQDGFSEEWVAQQLCQLGIPTRFAGYSHETSSDFWKIVTDSSLQGGRDDLCIEVVSPILMGESGIDLFREMMEGLSRLGIATNTSCGFHVHVDATKGANQALPIMGTLEGYKAIAHAFCCLEGAFDEIVARDENARSRRTNQNKYCQSNVLAFGTRSRRQVWERINKCSSVRELVQRTSPSRYHKLNLFNLTLSNRADTIEFRQHGGVDDVVTAEAWIRLILGFVTKASAIAPGSFPLQPQPYSVQNDLQQLFTLVDCQGLESFYTLERRLYHVSNDARQWRCRICRKRFRCSQDLARHASATNHR